MFGSLKFPKSIALYGLAIVMMKGFSLISIPLVTSYLTPADFGDLDLAASVIEFVALLSGLCLADMLYRFASGPDAPGKPGEAAAIIGTALIAGSLIGLIAQGMATPIHESLELGISNGAFRAGLLAACLTGLIELPLAWLRLKNRPVLFLSFVAGRSILQIGLIYLMLNHGAGANGVLYANAAVDTGLSAAMLGIMIRREGIAVRVVAFQRLFSYSLPLVGSALAMFALGAADRWFLADAISREALAHYAIAAKLALATSLAIQPLCLWWYPKRIGILQQPGGISKNAEVWTWGVTILAGGGAMISLAMPLFVWTALPDGYAPALAWLPALIVAIAMNELVSLSNAGAYLGKATWRVLGINCSAAGIALIGYAFLVPLHGIAGAIEATIGAQIFRLVAFAWLTRRTAPVPWLSPQTWMIAGISISLAALAWLLGDPIVHLMALVSIPAMMVTIFFIPQIRKTRRIHHPVEKTI